MVVSIEVPFQPVKACSSPEDAADAGATQEAVLLARLQVQRVLNATAPAVMEEARKRLAGARKSVDALPATLKGEGRKKLAAEAATHFRYDLRLVVV